MRRLSLALAAAVVFCSAALASAQGHLRVGMTASDIPYTGGQTDNGFEGFRFVGYQIYEPLIAWDLTRGDRLPPLVPGLAESWEVRKDNPAKWVFKLRKNVKFHDGSPFNADAVVFTFESIKKKDAPHWDSYGSGQVSFRLAALKSVAKIDEHTVEFDTGTPTSFVPYQIVYMLIVSPTQWQKVKDWRKFAEQPSGTGPFKVTRFVPRERLELEANKEYWNAARRPKLDKVTFFPMPEPTTRLAALRSGQVDWVEVPPPDSIPQLKGAGFQISTSPYPHNWTHTLRLDKGPWDNKLVRKAAELRRRPRRHLQGAPQRHVHPRHGRRLQGASVVRPAEGDVRLQPRQGARAAAPGRLRRRQAAAQGRPPDLDVGLGADAAARDERADPEEPEGGRDRRGPPAGRVEHARSRAGAPGSTRRTTTASTPGTSPGTSSSRGAGSGGSSTRSRWCPSP